METLVNVLGSLQDHALHDVVGVALSLHLQQLLLVGDRLLVDGISLCKIHLSGLKLGCLQFLLFGFHFYLLGKTQFLRFMSQFHTGLLDLVLELLLLLLSLALSFTLLKVDLDLFNLEGSLLLLDGQLLLVSQLLLSSLTLSLQFVVLDGSYESFRVDLVLGLCRNLFGFHSALFSELSLQVGEKTS